MDIDVVENSFSNAFFLVALCGLYNTYTHRIFIITLQNIVINCFKYVISRNEAGGTKGAVPLTRSCLLRGGVPKKDRLLALCVLHKNIKRQFQEKDDKKCTHAAN